MNTLVVCFCTEDYKPQAMKAVNSFVKQYPYANYEIIEPPIKEWNVKRTKHKLDWCFNRFVLFADDYYKQFDRVIMIDSDVEAIGNIDLLFSKDLNEYDMCFVPDYAAKYYYPDTTKDYDVIVNAGVFILNKSFFEKYNFLELLPILTSYNDTEQGYYTDFLRMFDVNYKTLPVKYNWCKDGYYPKEDDIRVIHYSGGY